MGGLEPPYQFTALEFTEPGTRVFFGPGSDSGLNIEPGRRRGRETENDRVTSPASTGRPTSCKRTFTPAGWPPQSCPRSRGPR